MAYASLLALLILGVKSGIGGHTLSAGLVGIGNSLKVCEECHFRCFQHTQDKLTMTRQYIFFLEIIYVVLTSVMKASLAFTLLQWAQNKVHRALLWTAIALDATICLVVVFYFLFQCQPISYAWRLLDPTVKGKCLPINGQIFVGFALCAVTVSVSSIPVV